MLEEFIEKLPNIDSDKRYEVCTVAGERHKSFWGLARIVVVVGFLFFVLFIVVLPLLSFVMCDYLA